MPADLSIFSKGAHILAGLRRLQPGQAFRVTRSMLNDVQVPANPLDRQTPEYLVEFFKIRLPFYVTVVADMPEGFADRWDFYRPTAEELERELERERK